MKYIKADEQMHNEIYNRVQQTIKEIYPKYYPKDVVDFFCELHSLDNIRKDIENENVYVLYDNNALVGTGCFSDNHITRVYVLPDYQGRGYGTYIIKQLENDIKKKYDTVVLDASLPAVMLYEKLGYKTVNHNKYPLKNDVVLIYEVMEKKLT
ncbi:MAG: GNAT family N-acetyltransferase [Clostridiales bacterium]|nr:GNAT family N-acetyltransferase [Clostridiales bacterium]